MLDQKYRASLSLLNPNDVRVIAFSYIQTETNVLDIGCACGDFGQLLFSKKQCRISGIDFDESSLIHAKHTHSYETLAAIDINHFNIDDYPNLRGSFDYISMLDVLEHTIDPATVLKSVLACLREGGTIIISLPNIAYGDIKSHLFNDRFEYTSTGVLDETHLRFFTCRSFAQLLATSGLIVNNSNATINYPTATDTLPPVVARYIMNDPHSYVYQFIAACSISNIGYESLFAHNQEQLTVDRTFVSKRLIAQQAKESIRHIAPHGSVRRRWLKALISRFNTKK